MSVLEIISVLEKGGNIHNSFSTLGLWLRLSSSVDSNWLKYVRVLATNKQTLGEFSFLNKITLKATTSWAVKVLAKREFIILNDL